MKVFSSSKSQSAKISLSQNLAALKDFLEGQNAVDVTILETDGQNAFADAIVVCGATSRRHAQGLADGIGKICHERGMEFLGMEGYDAAQWILVDCNDVVVNIFQQEIRNLYKLEELWARNDIEEIKS